MTTTELSAAVGAGVANLLSVVGDNKYWLGHHLSQWAVGTPGLESAVACAAISQGHLGQSRALLPIADELAGEGVSLGEPESRERRYNVTALDEEFDTWAQAVATLYLVDPALDTVLRSLGGVAEELDRRVQRVLDEARFNFDFARGRLLELTEDYATGRDQVAPHLPGVLTEVLAWFGPDGEPGVQALADAGVLVTDNQGMRQRYLDTVAPLLHELGYDVGVAGGPGAWTYPELPWESWNSLQRRLET